MSLMIQPHMTIGLRYIMNDYEQSSPLRVIDDEPLIIVLSKAEDHGYALVCIYAPTIFDNVIISPFASEQNDLI